MVRGRWALGSGAGIAGFSLSLPCLTAADDAGYEIDEAEVIYWGRCPTCRQAADGQSDLRIQGSQSAT